MRCLLGVKIMKKETTQFDKAEPVSISTYYILDEDYAEELKNSDAIFLHDKYRVRRKTNNPDFEVLDTWEDFIK